MSTANLTEFNIALGTPSGILPQATDKLTPSAATESAPSDCFNRAVSTDVRADSTADGSVKSIGRISTEIRSERALKRKERRGNVTGKIMLIEYLYNTNRIIR